jgi:hypothetical protein
MFHSFAYLDAGSGSLLLQALMGGFAGFVVVSRMVWQSFFRRPASVAGHEEPNQ